MRFTMALSALLTLALPGLAGMGQSGSSAYESATSAVSPIASSTNDGPAPDRIEEDWLIVIAAPDVDAVGPQFTTCMNPTTDNTQPFVAFDMNYQEYPGFVPGGMQLQVWSGGDVLSIASEGSAQFEEEGESITWTQKMFISDGQVNYQVVNGQSDTWGPFGSDLTVSFSASVTDLSGYSPDFSAAQSGATWESDHVTKMTLVQVRYYANGQLIRTDTNPRKVISTDDGNGSSSTSQQSDMP